MSKKIEVKQEIEIPSFRAPRACVWLFSIFAAPFTFGTSLLVGPAMFELGARKERQLAAEEIEKDCSVENDADVLKSVIQNGAKEATVASTYDLGYMGLGTVTRKTWFKIEDYKI